MSVKVVHTGSGEIKVTAATTPAIKVTSPDVDVVDINPVYTSGQPGPTGPTGAQGPAGANGQGVPTGGSADQVLLKSSGDDYDTEWGSVDYSDVTNTPTLSDVATSGDYDDLSNTPNLATVATSGAYGDLTGTPTIVNNVDTNLTVTRDATSVTVESSDGTNGLIPQSSTTQAGVMSAASHQKLANLNASADVTNSSSVEAAGAIMDSDFTSNGLMERTGDGSYDVVAKSTDNISEGSNNLYYTDARADARVSAVIDTDNTLGSPSDTLVPSQAAIKTYVDNQLGTQNLSLGTVTGTTVAVNISGGGSSVTIPAATTNDAGVMTEAQFDKLADIEENADVTDTANVTAAGALMDSEVTNLDQVKAFDSSDYATAAQGTTADNALPKAGGTMTGNITFSGSQTVDGRDLSADGAKLDNIEDNATADQTDAEIRAAVEAATDSNVFTDADHDKLNNIDANATNYGDSDVNAHLSGGTGIGYNNGAISVNVDTTIVTADAGDDATITVTGPSGQDDSIRIVAGSNVTVTQATDQIEIAATSGGIDAVEDDTDPDLGGDLDVGTHEIQSTSANNLVLKAAGTGKASLSAIDGDVELVAGGVGNYIRAKSDVDMSGNSIVTTSLNTDITLTPHGTGNVILGNFEFDADQSLTGKDDYVLTYDESSGHISLEEASAGSGTVDTTGTPSQNQVSYFSDADTIQGSTNLTFDGNELTLKGRRLLPNPTTGDTFLGDIVNFGSGPNGVDADIEQGKLYYLDTSLQWEEADANAAASAKGMLGIAIANDTPKFLVRGIARHASWTGLGNGSVLYVSAGATTGEITNAAPTGSADVVRVIGYCTNSTSREIFFNPSNDWIELA